MRVFSLAALASLSGLVISPTVSLGLALVKRFVKRFAKRFEVFIRLMGLAVAKGSARVSYEFMAAVLFSWKKGVETSTLVMFMAVFDFFRAVRLFNFLSGKSSVWSALSPLWRSTVECHTHQEIPMKHVRTPLHKWDSWDTRGWSLGNESRHLGQ